MINSASTAPKHPMNSMRPPVSNNRMTPHGNMNRGQMGNNAMRHKSQEFETNGIYKNSRFTFNMTTLVGCTVQVQVQNGKRYEGILKTFSAELELVLECVHLVDSSQPDSIPSRDRTIEKLIVNFKDMVTMEAVNADTRYGEAAVDSFTDVGISKAQVNGTVKEEDFRKLVKWDDGDTNETQLDSTSTGWGAEEMFRRNEEKFGVMSTFDNSMDQYTTKLDKSDTPEFHKKRAVADFYASQIEDNPASHANTALENGDDLDSEESRFSSVRRPPQRGSSPSKSDSTDQQQRYVPPPQRVNSAISHQQRGNSGVPHQQRGNSVNSQLSQSARFSNREPPRRDSDKRNKNFQQPSSSDVQKLKTWNSNFNMNTQSDSSVSSNKSPPKTDRRASNNSTETLPTAKAVASSQPPGIKPTQQAPVPVTEATVSKVEVAATASAAPHVPSPPAKSSVDIVTQEARNIPTNGGDATLATTQLTASAAEVKPTAATTVVESKLNPEAKEFVFAPKSVAPPPLSQPQPLMQQPPPPQHSHPQHFQKSKTATVSVEAGRQATRPAEMPTPAQAMGQPITMNPAAAAGVVTHQQTPQYIMVPQYGQAPRLHRVPSYPGSDGPPGPAHYIQTQPLIHGHHSFLANGMQSHVIPIPGQAQANMAVPPPPHNAQIHHQPPQSHQPSAVMNNGNPPAAAGHHVHHPNQHFPNHGNGLNYLYSLPQPAGQPNQPAQPPLQPSPHNPSPSPVNMNNGGPVVTYHNYAPPQSQQFYPPAQVGAAASHPAPQQYHQNQPHLVYIPTGQYASNMHGQLHPAYHTSRKSTQTGTGYATNYPPQQQQ